MHKTFAGTVVALAGTLAAQKQSGETRIAEAEQKASEAEQALLRLQDDIDMLTRRLAASEQARTEESPVLLKAASNTEARDEHILGTK
jgi:hypothetical protein